MQILLANPRGFCAGVERAIAIVERALEKFGAPIYVRHEVVHNKFVCDDLRVKGAVFIEELDEVPPGSTLVFSAHGVSKAIRAEEEVRGLKVFDATCPLVTKVHVEVAKMRNQAREVVMIGHKAVEDFGRKPVQGGGLRFLASAAEGGGHRPVHDPEIAGAAVEYDAPPVPVRRKGQLPGRVYAQGRFRPCLRAPCRGWGRPN